MWCQQRHSMIPRGTTGQGSNCSLKYETITWLVGEADAGRLRRTIPFLEDQYVVAKCIKVFHLSSHSPKNEDHMRLSNWYQKCLFSRKFAPLPCQIAFWDAWKLQTFGVSKVQNLSRSAPVGLNPCDTDWYPTQKWWSCMTFLMSIIISFQKWWNREVEEQHCRWIIWMKLYIQRGVELAVDASYQRFISMTHLLFQCMISARLQRKDQIELEFPMPNSNESWRLLGRWYWSLAGLRAVGTKLSDSGSIVEGS